MKRFFFSALVVLSWVAVLPGVARADDVLKRVQQSLRDQGFYYGTIDGSPGDETTQAIRRYQIRNGLPVTGQLTEDTRASIMKNSGGSGASAGGSASTNPGGSKSTGSGGVSVAPSGTVRPRSTPSVAATPRPAPESTPPRLSAPAATPSRAPSREAAPAPRALPPTIRADDGEEGGFRRGGSAANPPEYRTAPPRRADDDDDDAPVRPGQPRDLRAVPPNGIAPSATLSGLFADTPYEFAPPPVQANTLRLAQIRLLRQGFYDRDPDGRPNALMGARPAAPATPS